MIAAPFCQSLVATPEIVVSADHLRQCNDAQFFLIILIHIQRDDGQELYSTQESDKIASMGVASRTEVTLFRFLIKVIIFKGNKTLHLATIIPVQKNIKHYHNIHRHTTKLTKGSITWWGLY